MKTFALLLLALALTGCAPLINHPAPPPSVNPFLSPEKLELEQKQKALDLIDNSVIRPQAQPKP